MNMSQTFIRFAIEELDEKSTKGKGLFTAMGDLIDRDELFAWEVQLEKEISNWFRKNLRVPLVQSSDSNHYAKPRAISWFKDSAQVHIEKMRQYAHILEAHGYSVKQIVTERPGKILYEDQYQIAAEPFNDTLL
jgi:hypothetical protein